MTINAKSAVVTVKSQAVVGTPEAIVLGGDPSLRVLELTAEPRGEQLSSPPPYHSFTQAPQVK